MTKPSNPNIQSLSDAYIEFLSDESRIKGNADSISFPKNEKEAQTTVKRLLADKIPITVQGARTGITGAAVPICGHVLNLSKMNTITGLKQDSDGRFLISVQPGLLLEDLNRFLESGSYEHLNLDNKDNKLVDQLKRTHHQFWPPDPSEKSASIGGIIANNSRGICAYRYGSASEHLKSLRIIDMQGNSQVIEQDASLSASDQCSDSKLNQLNLWSGSEGMLGVFTELTLILQPVPKERWGIVFFFKSQTQALDYSQAIDAGEKAAAKKNIAAIEFMDKVTLDLIQQFKKFNSQLLELPNISDDFQAAVYIEIHGQNEQEVAHLCESLMALSVKYQSDPENSWAFSGENEIRRLQLFRAAAPEAVNHALDQLRQVDARIHKLSTDMCLSTKGSLKALFEMYDQGLKSKGLTGAIFGHAGDSHFHVNILPKDYSQFEVGKKLIEEWAEEISSKGGTIVKEHGVGKIKKMLFLSNPLSEKMKAIRQEKKQFDPKELWNPGNMLL